MDLEPDSSNTTMALKSFLQFPLLPPEIRLTIWSFACQIIRNVTLEVDTLDGKINFSDEMLFPRYHSSTRIPSILHTNREARQHALKYYDLSFSTCFEISKPDMSFSTPPHTYINWNWDRLVIMRPLQFWRIICAHQAHLSNFISDLKTLCNRNNLRRIAWNAADELVENYIYLETDTDGLDGAKLAILAGLNVQEILTFEVYYQKITEKEPWLDVLLGKADVAFVGEKSVPMKEYPTWEGLERARVGIAEDDENPAGMAVLTVATPVIVNEKGEIDLEATKYLDLLTLRET
jgi:hypothetical protein